MTTLFSRRRALSLFAASAFAALTVAEAAANADAEAEAYIARIGKDVLRLANAGTRGKATRNKFAVMLSKYVNLRGITMASLGTYQKQLPAEQMSPSSGICRRKAAATALLISACWVFACRAPCASASVMN